MHNVLSTLDARTEYRPVKREKSSRGWRGLDTILLRLDAVRQLRETHRLLTSLTVTQALLFHRESWPAESDDVQRFCLLYMYGNYVCEPEDQQRCREFHPRRPDTVLLKLNMRKQSKWVFVAFVFIFFDVFSLGLLPSSWIYRLSSPPFTSFHPLFL